MKKFVFPTFWHGMLFTWDPLSV